MTAKAMSLASRLCTSNGQQERGRWKMQEAAGTERDWKADLVLLAMGFVGPEQYLAESLGLATRSSQQLPGRIRPLRDQPAGVFAAGDCRRGQSLVVWAINEGRGAAAAIDRFLMEETAVE